MIEDERNALITNGKSSLDNRKCSRSASCQCDLILMRINVSGIENLSVIVIFECNARHISRPEALCNHTGVLCRNAWMSIIRGEKQEYNLRWDNFQAKSGKLAMGIDWMTRDELAQAIPPAYTEWIGKRIMEAMK